MRRWRLDRDKGAIGARAIVAFSLGLSAATAALVWLAWAANAQLRRSSAQLLERRASEVLALTSAALNRDMKGAWLSVLTPIEPADIEEDPPYGLLQVTSRAFAHFSYVESFILWTADGTDEGRWYVFSRTDRAVPWDPTDHRADPYPVALLARPPALAPVVRDIRSRTRSRRRFHLIETRIADTPYHVIVHRLVSRASDSSSENEYLAGFAGFTVNLEWVRREYFSELLRQVASIGGLPEAVALSVLDESHAIVATSGASGSGPPLHQRAFPLLFVEPSLVLDPPPAPSPVRYWTAVVQPGRDSVFDSSQLGRQTLVITSLAALASLVAVLLTVRSVRVHAELAAMKSEFVSTVTHELKTPLALIKLVGETLERGRYTSEETIRDYAAILSQEERRLSHLIENLLTYSRLSDLQKMSTYEGLEVAELVEDALQPFRLRLKKLGFSLHVNVDAHLPRVRGDRSALLRALANIIDNAIKYSPEDRRSLDIRAHAVADWVHLQFTDSGVGIPPDELPRVSERFFRGRAARELGSGLGLAIVRGIVERDRGQVRIRSSVGTGTTVEVILPAWRHA